MLGVERCCCCNSHNGRQICFDDRAQFAKIDIIPENATVVILSVEALVCRDDSVEQTLAGVETAQTLDQPPVTWDIEIFRFGSGDTVRTLGKGKQRGKRAIRPLSGHW